MLDKIQQLFVLGLVELLILILIIVLFFYSDKSLIPILILVSTIVIHVGGSLWSINNMMKLYIGQLPPENVDAAIASLQRDDYK